MSSSLSFFAYRNVVFAIVSAIVSRFLGSGELHTPKRASKYSFGIVLDGGEVFIDILFAGPQILDHVGTKS
jgi:Na+/pantothenate symporter